MTIPNYILTIETGETERITLIQAQTQIQILRKNKKKRDNKNDFQYQGNNAIEINQQTKDEYLEQSNNLNISGNNGHQNMYGKQFKKNQNLYNNNLINNSINSNLNNTIGSINTNTNTDNSSNISNLNLTPQTKNQITTPPRL